MKLFDNLFVRKDVIELKERLDKLERIMKYSKPDGPSFRIVKVCDDEDIEYMKWRGLYSPGAAWHKSAYVLFLYIDNEEYEIDLGREVDCYNVCVEKSKIKVYGGLAHLELDCACVDYITVLTVDYEKGKFVSERKAAKRGHDGYNSKVVMECIIDESVSFNDVYEKYDVIEQRGEIWVLAEKEKE